MSLARKLKMTFAAMIAAGMMMTGAETVRAAPATSTSQSAGSVQDLLKGDIQEARNGHRGYRGGGMRSGRMGYRGARGFAGRHHWRGPRYAAPRHLRHRHWRGHRHWRHRHWRYGSGYYPYYGAVGVYGSYCVRRIGWHYNAWGEYVYGPYRRCFYR